MTLACEPVHLRIRRFPRGYRRRLRKLVRGSKPLADLLYTFPGAAFVFAAPCRAAATLTEARLRLDGGRSLAEVAAALGLPMWLRRLPPEAFAAPLGTLPDAADFGRAIVNLVPADPEATAAWLQRVSFAAEACDDGFAIWLARHRIEVPAGSYRTPLLPLAAFAWFSAQPHTAARRLIRRPWHGRMRLSAAILEANEW